jgi:hypothetical protein
MLRAFVVHRAETGEVVHIHVQPCDLDVEVDEILTMVGDSSELAVLEVPLNDLPGAPAGLAVRDNRVIEVADVAMGGAGIGEPERGTRVYQSARRD